MKLEGDEKLFSGKHIFLIRQPPFYLKALSPLV